MDNRQKTKEQLIRELEETEQRLQALVNVLPGRAVILDAEGRYVEVLKQNHFKGTYQPDNVIGKSVYDVQRKEFADFCMSKIREVLETNTQQTIEYSFVNIPGKPASHHGYLSPWYDSDSGKMHVLWVSQDVTNHKQAEQKSRRSESRLRTVIDILPDRAVVLNAEGRYLDVIKRRQDPDAYQTSDVVGKTLHEVQTQEFADFCLTAIHKSLDTQAMQLIEYDFVNQVGKHVFYEARITPLELDETGEARVMWISRDITPQKTAEKALRESEKRLSIFVNTLPDRAVILSADGIYLDVIKRRETEIFEPDDVEGKSIYDIRSGEFSDFCMSIIRKTLDAGEIQFIEYDLVNVEDKHVYFEGRIAPLSPDPVHGERVLWISRDITKQKRAEEEIKQYRDRLEALVEERTAELQHEIAERKRLESMRVRQERLAAVGQLAAGIAHDFNNVMGIITFDSSMILRSDNLTERQQQKLQRIQRQAAHAANLIKQILDFSRRSAREPHILDLRILLKENVTFLEHTIPERIMVHFSYEKGEFPVNVDPTQFQQIITNFALNARDAIEGNGTLTFRLTRKTFRDGDTLPVEGLIPGQWVCLTISDTGGGIDPDHLPKVFEPFFTTKEVGKGTGLGLAQVYGIVQQHEGFINVDSHPGEGTAFTLYFPYAGEDAGELPEMNHTQPDEGNQEVILLVEDNSDLRDALADVLDALSYTVLQAKNGVEALAVFEEHQATINLIISDVVMPQMDGIELIRRLQNYSPLPGVLMMSGFRQDMTFIPDIEESVIGWLQKPVDTTSLAEAIRQALSPD